MEGNKIRLRMINNNIDILGTKMINICKYNNAWEMPRVYYEIQRDYNELKKEKNMLLEEMCKNE